MASVPGKRATFSVQRTVIYDVFKKIPRGASKQQVKETWVDWLSSQPWWRTSGYVLSNDGEGTFAARVHSRASHINNTRSQMSRNPRRQAKFMSGTYTLEVRATEREVTADKLERVALELKRMGGNVPEYLLGSLASKVNNCKNLQLTLVESRRQERRACS